MTERPERYSAERWRALPLSERAAEAPEEYSRGLALAHLLIAMGVGAGAAVCCLGMGLVSWLGGW